MSFLRLSFPIGWLVVGRRLLPAGGKKGSAGVRRSGGSTSNRQLQARNTCPNAPNPTGLNPVGSLTYPRNADRRTQSGYLAYYHTLRPEKSPVFEEMYVSSPRPIADSARNWLPRATVNAVAEWRGERNSSLRTKLACDLESRVCSTSLAASSLRRGIDGNSIGNRRRELERQSSKEPDFRFAHPLSIIGKGVFYGSEPGVASRKT